LSLPIAWRAAPLPCDLRHSAPPALKYSSCLLPFQPAREPPAVWRRGVLDDKCVSDRWRNDKSASKMEQSDEEIGLILTLKGGHCAREAMERNAANAPTTAVLVVATRLPLVEKLAEAWASWDEHFLDARTWVVLQVDPSRIAAARVVELLQLRAGACRLPKALLADGYALHTTPRGNHVLLLVKPIALPPIFNSLDDAAAFRTPHYCHKAHTGEYLVGTKWWVWAMARVAALDYFDYWLKVDADVVFNKRLVPSPAEAMALTGAVFAHTSRLSEADGEAACAGTLDNATTAYLRAAGCAAVDPKQYDGGMYYYSNLIGGWNGLFRSPQMRSYASFWWNWDGGWLHRWGDQQFWSHALYVTNATRMSRVRHDGVVVGGDVISLEHHRQHREFVHTGG
jgi:hypothetical protein